MMCYLPDGSRQSVLAASNSNDTIDGPITASPMLPPKPLPILYIVEAQFDCKPDNRDELAFQEGDKMAIIKVHSADWLVSRDKRTVHYSEYYIKCKNFCYSCYLSKYLCFLSCIQLC